MGEKEQKAEKGQAPQRSETMSAGDEAEKGEEVQEDLSERRMSLSDSERFPDDMSLGRVFDQATKRYYLPPRGTAQDREKSGARADGTAQSREKSGARTDGVKQSSAEASAAEGRGHRPSGAAEPVRRRESSENHAHRQQRQNVEDRSHSEPAAAKKSVRSHGNTDARRGAAAPSEARRVAAAAPSEARVPEVGKRQAAGSPEAQSGKKGAPGTPSAAQKKHIVKEEKPGTAAESEHLPENQQKNGKTGSQNARMQNIAGAASRETAEQERADSQKSLLRARRIGKLRIALAAVGAVFAAAYIFTAVYFSSHFYENTVIYGMDCSQKTASEVKAEVADKQLDEYRLEIRERGGKTEYLTAEQIGLEFLDNNSVDRMLKAQRSYIWPFMLFRERSDLVSVAFTYDQEKATDALAGLDCMNPMFAVAPRDAYVKTTDTGFTVEPEVMGTTLDVAKTQRALCSVLDGGKNVLSLEERDCYIAPEVFQDDEELQKIAAEKNELARANITYDFGDRQEVINARLIDEWIVKRTDGSYVIDDVAVTDYVRSLAEKYDTFGLSRVFYTSLGTTVTLPDGDYGWCMDQDATVVDLLNALADGYQGTMEPEYVYTAMSRDENDIGYTYVEICISQQRMWCYQDGVCIVDTPVVTGNPNKGNATPSNGVWSIDAKMRNYILVGEGYRSPVDYWMPFNGGVGIHDMQTRAYFGGSIYLSNGSHGCINTPYAQVQTIYNAVSVGTPVVVYD